MEKKSSLGLDKQLEIINKCQNELKIDSCFKCNKLLDCRVRNKYVEEVYKSMNPTMNNSGFEF